MAFVFLVVDLLLDLVPLVSAVAAFVVGVLAAAFVVRLAVVEWVVVLEATDLEVTPLLVTGI
ncbi:hypothetical protein [Leptothermofonsia sp. ETS-13]|uniref:hypothetical protein n=1 Tax=Leptothermofonsia sp. ETS-13 TaxID=3035696 RepID=UPI003B9E8393